MTGGTGKKRDRSSEDGEGLPHDTQSKSSAETASSHSTSNFRNVSACNRCRNRKNRCDQKLPKCTGCEKAGVKCVGFDPVSKRTIPRSYVYYLETRIATLEAVLLENNIAVPPPSDDFAINEAIKPGINVPFPITEDEDKSLDPLSAIEEVDVIDPALQETGDNEQLSRLVDNVGLVSVHTRPDPPPNRSNPSAIPFSKVVFAAVRSSVPRAPDRPGAKISRPLPSATASGGGGSDSFFGLNTKISSKAGVKPAPFPDKAIGLRLTQLYFEHANPQIPILHRGEFMSLFERVYAVDSKQRRPREMYFLSIVFAIGAGIINDTTATSTVQEPKDEDTTMDGGESPNRKRPRLAPKQHQPEEYHAAAIVHLDSFLGSSPAADGAAGGLEELQAVLLLASLALLRPVAPGLWYIIGVAVRLAVDLGLHFEDIDSSLDQQVPMEQIDSKSSNARGRKQWTRDFRRRLWWCTYSFDRLVSTCVGRPCGISDQVITTQFPSMLDDNHITPAGFLKAPQDVDLPSYKLVARHYFRLRLLQSEILLVLQHRQAEQARTEMAVKGDVNPYIQRDTPSSYLYNFNTFRDWRADIDRRLLEWKESCPSEAEIGVAFRPLFFELNYWQAIILLYRQSLAVPEPLVGELSPSTGEEVQSPGTAGLEAKEDEQIIFMKVAQAGQNVLKIYRQLHRLKLVNYTFLSTHHLFMSGMSFLYAVWQSPLVRSRLTADHVDFTVFIATSVLSDLIEKCPPAEACRDAFVRMSKATISMCESTTGFGSASTLSTRPLHRSEGYYEDARGPQQTTQGQQATSRRQMPMPQFDMNLKDLFSDDEIATRPTTYSSTKPLHSKRQTVPTMMSQDSVSYSPTSTLDQSGHTMSPPQTHDRRTTRTTNSANSTPRTSNNLPYNNIPQQSPYQSFLPLSTTTPPALAPHQQHQQTQQTQLAPDFPFETFDFLDDFSYPFDPTNSDGTQPQWSNGVNNDFDLSFGTGGTALFGGGAAETGNGEMNATNGWDMGGNAGGGGGVDLFDGFFFGGGGNSF